MNPYRFLSVEKAIAYLGDAKSAHQLLGTLNSTLLADDPLIANAIQNRNFEVLQKIWHQLKGFAPVFCQDELVAEITHTEGLCKQMTSPQEQAAALAASELLQANLQALQLEVAAQILQAAAISKPLTP
jgi:HPt (histidine-containing phosphotransfer) domain-containing protein